MASPQATVLSGKDREHEVLLEWNTAALSVPDAQVRVIARQVPAGGALRVRDPAGKVTPLKAKTFAAFPLPRNEEQGTAIQLSLRAPAQAGKGLAWELDVELVGAAGKVRTKPWRLRLPYEVVTPVLAAGVQSQPEVQLYYDTPSDVGLLTATAEGAPAALAARWELDPAAAAAGVRLEGGFRQERGVSPDGGSLKLGEGGRAETRLFVLPRIDATAAPQQAGPLRARLILSAPPGAPALRDAGTGAVVPEIPVEVSFTFPAARIGAYFEGERYQDLPPQKGPAFDFTSTGGGEQHYTSDYGMTLRFYDIGQIPDALLDRPVRVRVADRGEALASEALFEFAEEGRAPGDTATVREVADGKVKGLILKAQLDARPFLSSAREHEAVVELVSGDPAFLMVPEQLTVYVQVPPRTPAWVWLLGVLGVLALAVLVLRLAARQGRRRGRAPALAGGGGPFPSGAGIDDLLADLVAPGMFDGRAGGGGGPADPAGSPTPDPSAGAAGAAGASQPNAGATPAGGQSSVPSLSASTGGRPTRSALDDLI